MKNKEMITGLFNMADEEYFGKAEVTNSSFRLLSESALHLANADLFKLEGGKFTFGSALHCMVLEPDEFEKRYATESFDGCDLNKNSNAYKDAKKNWLKSIEGKEILSVDDFEKIKKMSRNVKAIAGPLLQDGQEEIAMFAEMNGVHVSGKADYINNKLKYIFDLKTTQDIKRFGTSMVDYNYVTQSALYIDLMKQITGEDYKFAFILVETTAPHMVRIATASKEVVEIGRQMYGDLLQKYVDYRDNGIIDVEKTAQAPEWFLKKYGYGTEI